MGRSSLSLAPVTKMPVFGSTGYCLTPWWCLFPPGLHGHVAWSHKLRTWKQVTQQKVPVFNEYKYLFMWTSWPTYISFWKKYCRQCKAISNPYEQMNGIFGVFLATRSKMSRNRLWVLVVLPVRRKKKKIQWSILGKRHCRQMNIFLKTKGSSMIHHGPCALYISPWILVCQQSL